MDQDTRRAIDLVWEQGINVIRHDVQELARGITSAKRWFIGLVIAVIPSYVGLAITLLRK
jgi:hypothetical protein